MNPIVRRRLPPSVRSLLTDIGPKEEWIDREPDPEPTDGFLLPPRGAAGQEELLTPARTGDDEGTDDGRTLRLRPMCAMCECKPSCYTCPRCNLPYCGLACYRSPHHSVCSEEFYKESVLQELKEMGKTGSEGRQKMQDILLSLREKAERTDGGMEGLLREAGVVSDEGEGEAEERVKVMELLSRLAELQQSGDGCATEIEDILGKLKEIGGGGQDGDEDIGDLDEEAVSVEGELDLATRLSGLDIDQLSQEELWEILDSQEKEKFMALMKGGALGGLVPLWRPWWEDHEEGGSGLVEMLEEEVGAAESKKTESHEKETSPGKVPDKDRNKSDRRKGGSSRVPVVSAKILKLSSLCADPSPLVCYALVNALFGYSFTLCLFNGCTDSLTFEFCDMILSLSEALSSSRVFNCIQEALDCGESAILSGGHLDKEDPGASARALEATAHIVTGRSREDPKGYCLAALSQLRSVLSQARAALHKEGEEGEKRRRCFLASKKCEFFQAWVWDSERSLINRLALELWHEHGRRDRERNMMEKAKGVVEGSWKGKGRKNDKSKMIEELN